jgi:hypothetical protein
MATLVPLYAQTLHRGELSHQWKGKAMPDVYLVQQQFVRYPFTEDSVESAQGWSKSQDAQSNQTTQWVRFSQTSHSLILRSRDLTLSNSVPSVKTMSSRAVAGHTKRKLPCIPVKSFKCGNGSRCSSAKQRLQTFAVRTELSMHRLSVVGPVQKCCGSLRRQ